ncbi:MAG: hypothetical protein CL916_14210 [Deltaproteobacteria bacterium]|nr:hypothetical protein [Deltaproteobacteria bacterium]
MNRLIRLMSIPMRIVLMVFAVISLFWGYQQGLGLQSGVLGGVASVFAGLALSHTRIRKRALVFCTILGVLLTWLLGWSVTHFYVFSSFLGITEALSLQLLIYGFGFVFFVATLIRTLAIRQSAMYFVEFWILALAAASAFAPHRNHIVLQPLWLSDWAWENGLEPTFVLGSVGAVLALLLAVVTLLEKTKRIPVALIFLPFLALLAFRFIDPTELNKEEPQKGASGTFEEMQGKNDKSGSGGGSGKNDPREEGSRNPKPNDGGGGESKPVAVVILETDYEPPSGYFYMRQEGLSSFTGKRLNASRDREIPYDGFVGFPTTSKRVVGVVDSEERLEIHGKVSLLAPHTAPFGVESIIHYEPTVNPRPAMFNRTYAFTSTAQNEEYESFLYYDMGDDEWSDNVWEHFTKAPSDPRYKDLADEIIAKLPEEWQENPFAKALAIKLYLDENTRYTKKVRHEKASDPTGEFLFGPVNQFIGYCVHTSHAAVYLWRSIGIPARVGVGYAVDMQNTKTDGFVIYDADAHAWPELYFEGVGWIPLDIAPAENLDQQGEPPDPALQDSLMELSKAQEDSRFQEPIDWAALWAKWKGPLFWGSGLFVLGIFVFHYCIKLYRRIRHLWSNNPRHIYISAVDTLSENGVRRDRGESPEAFARRVQSVTFLRITHSHIAHALGTEPIKTKREPTGMVLKERADIPLWRRWVGLLNPFSFYLSR